VQQSFQGPFSGKSLLIFSAARSFELVRSIVGDYLSLEDVIDPWSTTLECQVNLAYSSMDPRSMRSTSASLCSMRSDALPYGTIENMRTRSKQRQLLRKEGRRCLLLSGDVTDRAFCHDAIARTFVNWALLMLWSTTQRSCCSLRSSRNAPRNISTKNGY
jgi:hypothetical protein